MDPMLEMVIKEIKQDIREVKAETRDGFDLVNAKVDKLLQFKWQIIGGGVVISAILTIAFQVLGLIAKH